MKKTAGISLVTIVLLVATQTKSQAQTLSDNEIKKNIAPIENPLKSITALEPKVFEYNTATYNYLKLPPGSHYGFISEDVKLVFPAMVKQQQYQYMQGKNFFKKASASSVQMQQLIPVLVAAIKEQQVQIDALKNELEELKKKLR